MLHKVHESLLPLLCPIGDLVADPSNIMDHDERSISSIAESLREYGQDIPLIAQAADRVVKIGNGRLAAALRLGWTHVAVLFRTDDQITMIGRAVADNRTAQLSTWNKDFLSQAMDVLDQENHAKIGWMDDELSRILNPVELEIPDNVAPEFVPPVAMPSPGGGGDDFDAALKGSGPTRTKAGDLWVIGGKHRVLIGDSTVPENVARLMDGRKVGLCFTSPPYAQQRDYGDAAKEKVQDWLGLMRGVFANLPMTDDGQVLVNLGLIHDGGEWVPYWDGWIEWMRSEGWRRFGWYVWDKTHGRPGEFGGRFAPAHEWVFHFNRAGAEIIKSVKKKAESVRMGGGTGDRSADGKMKGYRSSPESSLETHKIPDSVFRLVQQMGGVKGHPAPYPIELPSIAIRSWPFDVYDPFLGSGTTLIAAHRLGRTFYGCELEPRYGDVILRRAEAEGLTAELAD